MIKGVARALVKPECKDAFLALAREFVALNRRENGNISYDLFIGLENPCLMTFIEEWSDRNALERHLASAHFRRIAPQFAAMQQAPTQADIYIHADL